MRSSPGSRKFCLRRDKPDGRLLRWLTVKAIASGLGTSG